MYLLEERKALSWFPKGVKLLRLHLTRGCMLLTHFNFCVPLPYQNFNALQLILVKFVKGFKNLKGEVAKYQFQECGCPNWRRQMLSSA